ncbi:MAG: hypothetical protein Q8R55_02470 [Candidatus Taylorbacteria bacterium]|nr:hypothetical protein [Candidatus Taylorbacteria bacterium]
MNFIKYTIWPTVKVKAIYWWWIIKYGGKKNIPPDMIFGKIGANLQGIKNNLMDAIRVSPGKMDKKEMDYFMQIMEKLGELDQGIRDAKNQKAKPN